jgi:hypothetical protein
MGRVGDGQRVESFVGVSEAVDTRGETDGTLDVAKLSEALASAAQQAINAGIVGPGKTVWVRLDFIDIELANQHPKTVRIGVTPLGS